MAPQVDEPADGAAAVTERLDDGAGRRFVLVARTGFRPLDQPFDEHPRFGIAQAAHERLVPHNPVHHRPAEHASPLAGGRNALCDPSSTPPPGAPALRNPPRFHFERRAYSDGTAA